MIKNSPGVRKFGAIFPQDPKDISVTMRLALFDDFALHDRGVRRLGQRGRTKVQSPRRRLGRAIARATGRRRPVGFVISRFCTKHSADEIATETIPPK